MKHCAECGTDFPDSNQFCEFDGTSLVSVDTDARLKPDFDAGLKPESNLKMIAIAVGGVVIGVTLFLIYYAMTRVPTQQSSSTQSSNSSVVMQQQAPLVASVPLPVPSASPSVEPSPSPSPSATPVPSPQTERRLELSSNAISTDVNHKTKSGPLIIRLNDGSKIETDEAWQTREGIWYRKGGVIALLDPKQVKAIEKVKPATSPSATPAPSPSQSPPALSAASKSSPRILVPTRRQR